MQAAVECTPSRFLEEIPENLIEYHDVKKTEPVSEEKAHDYFADMLKKLKS